MSVLHVVDSWSTWFAGPTSPVFSSIALQSESLLDSIATDCVSLPCFCLSAKRCLFLEGCSFNCGRVDLIYIVYRAGATNRQFGRAWAVSSKLPSESPCRSCLRRIAIFFYHNSNPKEGDKFLPIHFTNTSFCSCVSRPLFSSHVTKTHTTIHGPDLYDVPQHNYQTSFRRSWSTSSLSIWKTGTAPVLWNRC